MAGVAATNATGTVELRAMYGGLQTAIGALALLAGLSPAWPQERADDTALCVRQSRGLLRRFLAQCASHHEVTK